MTSQKMREAKLEVQWFLGAIHPVYGEVTMCGMLSGEPYRWFTERMTGVISMVPLSLLMEQN